MSSSTPVPAVGATSLTTEVGITGTPNFSGQLLTEQNSRLSHTKAFGLPGVQTWGEWEKARKTNPFVAMALDFVTAPIRDARTDVRPADDSSEAKRIADFVKWNLTEALEPSLPTFLEQTARNMLGDGFVFAERVYAVQERGVIGGQGYVLAKLADRLSRSVHENGWIERDGDLVAIRQQGPRNDGSASWVTVDVPAEKILLFSWQRRGNDYQGVSAFRPVWKLIAIQEMLQKVFAISSQREAAGIPVAEIATGSPMQVEDKNKLEEFLANMVFHEAASAVLPAGVTLKWLFSPAANKGHVIQAWRDIGLAVLQTLQAQQMVLGTQDTGSRSVGEVHQRASTIYVQSVVAALEQVFNGVGSRKYTGVIRQLVDLNFGPQKAYPKLAITLQRAELAAGELATAAKTGVEAGLFKPSLADENAFREKLGFEPVDEAERKAKEGKADESSVAVGPTGSLQDTALNGAQVASAVEIVKSFRRGELARESALAMLQEFFDIGADIASAMVGPELSDEEKEAQKPPAPQPFGAPKPPAEVPPDEKPTPPEPGRRKASAQRTTWEPTRPLRESEKFVAFFEIASFLDDSKLTFEREAKPAVVEMLVRAQAAITEAMKDGDPSEVATLPLDTTRLDKVVDSYLARVRKEGARQVRGEMARARPTRKMSAAASDEEDDKHSDPDPTDVQENDAIIVAQRKALVRRMTNRLRSELETEALDAARTDDDAESVVLRTVANQLETGAFQADAGICTTRIFNLGRDEAARLMGATEVEYSAALDSATCEPCQAKDGQRADVGSADHDELLPPNRDCDGRDRCRCLLVYVPGASTDEGDDE